MQRPPAPEDPDHADRVKADVGRRITELRDARGLSRLKFAEALGASPQYASRVERGTENLTIENMVKIAGVLGVHPRDLLTEPGPPVPYRRGRRKTRR